MLQKCEARRGEDVEWRKTLPFGVRIKVNGMEDIVVEGIKETLRRARWALVFVTETCINGILGSSKGCLKSIRKALLEELRFDLLEEVDESITPNGYELRAVRLAAGDERAAV